MKDLNLIIFGCLRYALGRQTYMSSTTVDFIINNIELLDINDLLIIKNELTHAFKIDNLGMECDRDEWCRLLEVINKQILILEYKNERK